MYFFYGQWSGVIHLACLCIAMSDELPDTFFRACSSYPQQKPNKSQNTVQDPKHHTKYTVHCSSIYCCANRVPLSTACALVCDKNGNLARNLRFLPQTNCKQEKILRQPFLKESRATYQKSGDWAKTTKSTEVWKREEKYIP